MSAAEQGSGSGEPAEARLTDEARAQIRAAIREAGGSEVFFVGRLQGGDRVAAVEPRARGHRGAAPALLGAARPGEVVIHNHPSGVLLPSDADLSVASSLGNLGVGFLIVDDEASRVYVVVEPHVPRARHDLERGELEADLGPEGALAASLPGYEFREAQVDMSRAVARAFDRDGVAMIEAGTGTGKSFAYLFPAARSSLENGEKVVVSTNTINLQTQLLEKDVPAVSRALGKEVRATLVKGRTNYLCLRKLEEARREPALFDADGSRAELDALASYAEASEEGSRQGLGFVPRSEIWERVQSESDTTLRVRCPHYNECFFYNSRRRAATADLVVANHHLLLSDAEIRKEVGFGVSALLPPYKRLIVDEAHHLEEAATSHLAEQLSRLGLLRITSRLLSSRRGSQGRIPNLVARLRDLSGKPDGEAAASLARRFADVVVPEHRHLVQAVDVIFQDLEHAFGEHAGRPPEGREVKRRVVEGYRRSRFYEEELRPRVEELAREVQDYADVLSGALRLAEMLPEELFSRVAGAVLDVRSGARRLEQKAVALRFFLLEDSEHCRWIEYRRRARGTIFRLCHAPVEVGTQLREVLVDRLDTVVLTSATLRTGSDFSYVRGRLGLVEGMDARLETLALPSPFDYRQQSLVGVPADLPGPGAPGFGEALAEAVWEAVGVSRGRAFVLFTSYRLLDEVHRRLAERLRRVGYPPLKQGEMDRHALLERFRTSPGAVLFATSSFWEGVDVPGDALSLVVLTKLPFVVPGEPILEARRERIEARGGDAFREYSLPQAVLRFRQGFGRLIRRRSDRGVVLVTDRRVIAKRYGKAFLDGLPVPEVESCSLRELLPRMEAFLRGEPSP